MTNTKFPIIITKSIVSDKSRLSFLPKHLENSFNKFESIVYQYMRVFCDTYKGGYWEYFELSNGGFYMAPAGDERFNMFVGGNGFDAVLSSDAAGIVVCTFALNQIIWQREEEKLLEAYYLLLDYADQHKESNLIFSAID